MRALPHTNTTCRETRPTTPFLDHPTPPPPYLNHDPFPTRLFCTTKGLLAMRDSFPPSDTWLSLIACAAFEATLLFLCFHEQGADRAKRGPSILGRWLKRRKDGSDGGAAPVRITPPSSVVQSWRLGALHERFFKGAHAGDESTLREAGEVLGVGRSLTEVRGGAVDFGVCLCGWVGPSCGYCFGRRFYMFCGEIVFGGSF